MSNLYKFAFCILIWVSSISICLSQSCGTRSGNFGQKFSNDIIGGCYAQLGEFPWEGLMEITNYTGNVSVRDCGVTLLSSQYALTSGRCVQLATSQDGVILTNIRFGILNRTDYTVENNTISQYWIHPLYNQSQILHNIALIKLGKNVTFGPNVQPICIATDDSSLTAKSNSVAGWGWWSLNSQYCGTQNTNYANSSSPTLVKTLVPVINNNLCQLYYPDNNVTFTNNTLCAGTDFTGAATVDDWGTPLMVANDSGTWFQTGIYSAYFYIDDQHDLLAQRLYTRVSSYCDWLTNLTNGDVQCYQAAAPTPPPTPPPSVAPSNNICGNRVNGFNSKFSNNIYGGCFANQGEFPWEGLMEIYSEVSGAVVQYCGVTLLSPNYALTTASCIVIARTTGYAHIIRFGMVNRTDTSAIANTIAQGFTNPQYINNGILHNVGIIKLSVRVNFNDKVQPICIPYDDSSLISQANTVAGWGYWSLDPLYCGNISTGGAVRNRSDILVRTTVPVIKNTLCQLYYPSFNVSLTPDTLCAGSDFNGAGNNSDWATPLMVPDANGVWFQTGVMSTYFYNNYNGILAQRVYARVSSYCSWFNTTTNGEVQCVYANTAPVVSITTITTPVNTASTTTIPATTPTTPSSITCGTRSKSFERKFSNDIIGGCYAQLGEFPWEGLMQIVNFTGNVSSVRDCGVTLLSTQYALTSGRCVQLALSQNGAIFHTIRFGILNRTDYTVENNNIAQAWIYPLYNESHILHNIALIKLGKNVTFGPNIQPICIPTDDSSLTTKHNSVAGWGWWSLDADYCGNQYTNYANSSSQILVKTTVPVINNVLCQLYYPDDDYNITFTNNTLCAGSDFTGAATVDDWGTPLMVPDARGAWFQTGIYSAYFYNEDQHDILGQRLYTRVSSYCDWLSNLTNNDVQCYQPKPPSPPPPPPKNICGNRNSNFTSMLSNNIYGGCFAQQGEFPWEGLMEIYSSTTGATLQYCGVTLLSSNYALTTASCLTISRYAGYSHIIRFGMANRTDSKVIVNTIAQGFINPQYINNGILHNVGIIRLTVSMNFNDNIQPICIPNDDSSLITQANTVAGWGAWSLDSRYCGNESTSINRTTSEILVKTKVPVINNYLCQLYYPSFNTSLTPDTLCAGSDSNGASNVSDWATPLMVPDTNGVWFQTGVMSVFFYTPQKTILAQRVYARVSSYCAWFNATTNGEVQCVAVNATLNAETTTTAPATPTVSIVSSATPSSTATVNTTTENKPAPSKSNRIFSFTTLLAIEFLIIVPFIF